jgi:hypothetical protein
VQDQQPSDVEPTGPYLAAAFLCERLLQDKDGVYSAIRLVDRIIQTATGPQPPAEMPPLPVNLTAFVSFKAGAARGRHTVTLRLEDPSGIRSNLGTTGIVLEGDDRGANVAAQLGMNLRLEGLYWIDVLLGGNLVTRMPLRLIYQPIQTQG